MEGTDTSTSHHRYKNKTLEVIGVEQMVGLSEVPTLGGKMLKGETKGRYVIQVDKELD